MKVTFTKQLYIIVTNRTTGENVTVYSKEEAKKQRKAYFAAGANCVEESIRYKEIPHVEIEPGDFEEE